MRTAVMQPYVFPYIGYFQLIKSTDNFVFYDDVNFIKQGWINRNNILVNKNKSLFTIPLLKASSFVEIKDTSLNLNLYEKWKSKFLKSIKQSYAKAPFLNEVLPIIEQTLDENRNIAELAIKSIVLVADYLNLETNFYKSSKDFFDTKGLNRTDRLISICSKLNTTKYINTLSGKDLYDKDYFYKNGINLEFLNPKISNYNQSQENFIPGLSIIDILMFNDKEAANMMLTKYHLI